MALKSQLIQCSKSFAHNYTDIAIVFVLFSHQATCLSLVDLCIKTICPSSSVKTANLTMITIHHDHISRAVKPTWCLNNYYYLHHCRDWLTSKASYCNYHKQLLSHAYIEVSIHTDNWSLTWSYCNRMEIHSHKTGNSLLL